MSDKQNFFAGLLGNPAFNFGVGLLSASGNRRGPRVSLGQAVSEASQYANRQQLQANQLNAQRQALQQKQQQQQAISQIPSLLNTSNVPASIRAPAGLLQQRMTGLLAQAAPEQFAQGLLSQQFAQPRAIPREAALAQQMFPGVPLEQSIPRVMQMLNPADPQELLEAQRLKLEVDSLLADAEERRDNTADEARQEQMETGLSQNSIDTSIDTIGGIARNLQTIAGTDLQPGAPLPSLRRGISGAISFGQQMLGMDSSERQKLNTALDLVNKDLNGLILDTVRNFGDRLTVQQTRILEEASANENITPQAIASVLEVALNARKFAAENDPDLKINNAEEIQEIEQLLQEIKSFGGGQRINWGDLPQ